jgi:uncharacterized membrane protein YbhN (UPF0104 family)
MIAALRRRRRLVVALRIAAIAITVGFCAYGITVEWSKAAPRLDRADPLFVALAFLAVAAYYLVFIVGWIRILAAWGIRIPYRAALQAEMFSMLAKYVPGGVWTPAARVVAIRRVSPVRDTPRVLASILIEAGLSAISGVLVFVVSLAWVHGVDAPLVPLVGFAVLCGALLHPRIFRPLSARVLRRWCAVVEPLPFRTMLGLLGYYCLTWLLGGCGLYFLIRSLGSDPGASAIAFLGGTAAVGAIVAVLAVFAPSGLGVREASMYGLLLAITSPGVALGATILNRLAITAVELALFVVGAASWRAQPQVTTGD